MLYSVLFLLAASVTPDAGATAGASAKADTSVPARTEAAPAEEKPICRSVGSSSSRIGKTRVCKSREEWAADSKRGQSNARGVQGMQGN